MGSSAIVIAALPAFVLRMKLYRFLNSTTSHAGICVELVAVPKKKKYCIDICCIIVICKSQTCNLPTFDRINARNVRWQLLTRRTHASDIGA